jgi:DNA-binding NarL/FixJ family response regulator
MDSLNFTISCACGARIEGEVVISTGQTLTPDRPLNVQLSTRQLATLSLIASGHTDRDIAAALGLSLNQAKRELRALLSAMSATNRAHAAVLAVRTGLLD